MPITTGTFRAADPELEILRLALPDADSGGFDKSATQWVHPSSSLGSRAILRGLQEASDHDVDANKARVAHSVQAGQRISFGYYQNPSGTFCYAFIVNPPN